MAGVFDIFRSGYLLGQQHGEANERRRAAWELMTMQPVTWIPFVDRESFLRGYRQGYEDALQAHGFIQHWNR